MRDTEGESKSSHSNHLAPKKPLTDTQQSHKNPPDDFFEFCFNLRGYFTLGRNLVHYCNYISVNKETALQFVL